MKSRRRNLSEEVPQTNTSPSRLHGLVLHQIAGSPAAIDHETVLYSTQNEDNEED
ncbi:hypothetical protein F2Q69_00010336 [Brassica cretica]|uniref:Uncharacterized protein n=1 Tax=Brassica cretica TaxID=69181 RepID=A0A8S9QW95_BRACR|nr:hypothetical protein F2Q69_00010336 [Brassica cretica]